MEIGYTPEQEALRPELREYYEKLLDPDTVAELSDVAHGIGPARRAASGSRCAPTAGSAIGWPKEYGGQGRSAIEQFIFFDESMRAGAPVPMLTINTRRPDDHALRHRRAEASSSSRRSSPARSTSASATPSPAPAPTSRRSRRAPCATATSTSSTARRCGRRSPATPTTAGSRCAPTPRPRSTRASRCIIVPMDTPGITVSPLDLLGDHDINQVFFDDVRVPVANCVGGENNGWKLITNQLNHERVTLCSSGSIGARARPRSREWAQDDEAARRPPRDRPGVGAAQPGPRARQRRRAAADELAGRRGRPTQGVLDIGHCSSIKVFGTEFYLEALAAAHGDPRARSRTSSPTHRARCCARGSRPCTAARSSSRSAAAPTSRSAT